MIFQRNLSGVNYVRPKKYLGQHFLKEDRIALKIVDALPYVPSNLIIEVGPGMGVLTRHLLNHEHFLAFDVDKESIEYLKSNFPDQSDKFLLMDFIKADLKEYDSKLSIIGNFPYNISSQIFFKIWENKDLVTDVVCMIQKEVADRIASKEGSKVYGILSVLLQAFYNIEYLFTVSPGNFIPPPKVQSAVIKLTRNNTDKLRCDEEMFKKVVKTAFGKRRKTLRNALKDLNLDAQITKDKVFDLRAEQLSVEMFVDLTLKDSS